MVYGKHQGDQEICLPLCIMVNVCMIVEENNETCEELLRTINQDFEDLRCGTQNSHMSLEDKKAISSMRKTIQKENDYYSVRLL